MGFDPGSLAQVTLADTPEDFARALREATDAPKGAKPASAWRGDARRTYQRHFSPEAYRAGLLRVVGPLIENRRGESAA